MLKDVPAFYRWTFLLVLPAGGFLWFVLSDDAGARLPTGAENVAGAKPDRSAPGPAAARVGATLDRRDSGAPEAPDAEEVQRQLEELGELLPQWMLEGGDRIQDRREINGHVVLRTRARYQWEGGEQLEIEITDIGADADEDLKKSLGFDLNLSDTESEAGYTATQALPGYLINEEYDYDDQAGSLQLLIEGRYLLEIQIEDMPQEAFQEILDRDVPFDRVFSRLDK